MIDFLLAHVTPQHWIAGQAALIAVLALGAAHNLRRML